MLRAASWTDDRSKTRSTVFLAYDDLAMQAMLAHSLQPLDLDVELVECAAELLELLDPTQCGCLVLGQRIGPMTGLEFLAQLADRGISMPFLFLAAQPNVAEAVEAMRRGAADVLIPPFDLERFVAVVRQALETEGRLLAGRASQALVRQRIDRLSPREREVLGMVFGGRLTKQIAASLLISTKTVETHRSHIMKKLEVDCLAQLIRLAKDFERELTNLPPTPLSDERSRARPRRAS
jgi:two-component system, LuxR family, response regulator FixJ